MTLGPERNPYRALEPIAEPSQVGRRRTNGVGVGAQERGPRGIHTNMLVDKASALLPRSHRCPVNALQVDGFYYQNYYWWCGRTKSQGE